MMSPSVWVRWSWKRGVRRGGSWRRLGSTGSYFLGLRLRRRRRESGFLLGGWG